jgi:hypothetical protein
MPVKLLLGVIYSKSRRRSFGQASGKLAMSEHGGIGKLWSERGWCNVGVGLRKRHDNSHLPLLLRVIRTHPGMSAGAAAFAGSGHCNAQLQFVNEGRVGVILRARRR